MQHNLHTVLSKFLSSKFRTSEHCMFIPTDSDSIWTYLKSKYHSREISTWLLKSPTVQQSQAITDGRFPLHQKHIAPLFPSRINSVRESELKHGSLPNEKMGESKAPCRKKTDILWQDGNQGEIYSIYCPCQDCNFVIWASWIFDSVWDKLKWWLPLIRNTWR